ncbi:L,D-transpeptidase family protein [Streptomyces purpureus]|uniref:Lipoprotein n=1 Tax=Streptomyces purpureus TaxID=1951 RepID=A0A918GZ02_9ACTN|nr:L,D-transpeptidase family protein [Streptomyces purpureus]GGT20258.1 lipoprotein [Streptomyces purpureus]
MAALRPPRGSLRGFLCAGLLLAVGCTAPPASAPEPRTTTQQAADAKAEAVRPAPAPPREIPGLGPATRAAIPATARQAVVVTGAGPKSYRSTVVRYVRDPATGWSPVGTPWPAHNALKGWTGHHIQGDKRSPIGVFGLTDAGGLLPDPGTRLPYDRGRAFTARGTGALGEPLAGSFDYVVAINYNRRPGRTPLDWTRPLGPKRGGGIWLHVDHNGPTEGCVSVTRAHMRELLRWLDPSMRPVVVMGDGGALRR